MSLQATVRDYTGQLGTHEALTTPCSIVEHSGCCISRMQLRRSGGSCTHSDFVEY